METNYVDGEPNHGTISVIETSSNTVVETINGFSGPFTIAITPDGRYAYVTNYNTLYAGSDFTDFTAGQGTVNIIDLTENLVLSPTIVVGQSPDAIAITPSGKHAYVSHYTSNTVTIIQLRK
jgi:DNA-binding beta-propeller fold protein YncE